jgi:2-dehydropantoate 2-reductase
MLRHAVLGAGGVGGLVAAALARAGADVVLLLRPETLAAYPGRLTVESVTLGEFDVEVPATSVLDREVDVLWVTVKATGLDAALELAPAARVGSATVIPLLNGVDHLAVLRGRYRHVVAGAIRVESERTGRGLIVHSSPFVRVDLAGGEPVAADVRAAGIECVVDDDEVTLLWGKLCFLAPVALATTALDGPLGAVRDDPRFVRAIDETVAVAQAEGARISAEPLHALALAVPPTMRSSMQKDVAAGRAPELDAIAGPVQRGGARHGIPVPATAELAGLVAARAQGGEA